MERLIKIGLVGVSLLIGASAWAQAICPAGTAMVGQNTDGSPSCAPQAGGGYYGGSSAPSYMSYMPPKVIYKPSSHGAVAYGPDDRSATSWNHANKSDAERAAAQSCGHKDCWAYGFVGGFAAIAKQKGTGELFAEWSAQSVQKAKAAAIRSCEKEVGKNECQIVVSGAAEK